MKVILRADVENLGHLGDIVVVKAGYGRNYLLPQGIAMIASPGNTKIFELERAKLQGKMDELRSGAQQLASRIEGFEITIIMRAGENDRLYGSVTTHTIGDALEVQGINIDRRRIILDQPIRTLGEHLVRVRLHPDVLPTMTVKVVSEESMRDHNEQSADTKPEESAE